MFLIGKLSIAGRLDSIKTQGGGKQVLAPIVLQQTRCLASILVFGPKSLVLGSSMALITTKTIHDFLEGKFTDYIKM